MKEVIIWKKVMQSETSISESQTRERARSGGLEFVEG
jgi:hypothetical protein